jgi:hypothetical protein
MTRSYNIKKLIILATLNIINHTMRNYFYEFLKYSNCRIIMIYHGDEITMFIRK